MNVLLNCLNTFPPLLLTGLTVLATTSVRAADIKVWEASINPQTKERYIPVELRAGAERDGNRELKTPKADSKQIDFQFHQSCHCLEFYRTATDRDEKRFYDRQTYIYCPGKSMVSQIQHRGET